MSFEFLSPGAATGDAIARSPMERAARAAGARFELRDGWNVAVEYAGADGWRRAAGWADVSHLGKLELQGARDVLERLPEHPLELGRATRAGGAWWCPITRERMLVLCAPDAVAALRTRLEDEAEPAGVVEVTTAFAALTLVGPLAREVIARFSAIDLRPHVTPVAGVRPCSLARQPGLVVREDEERYLLLFGWAIAQYLWTQVADAGERLGALPIGVDTLDPIAEPAAEVRFGA